MESGTLDLYVSDTPFDPAKAADLSSIPANQKDERKVDADNAAINIKYLAFDLHDPNQVYTTNVYFAMYASAGAKQPAYVDVKVRCSSLFTAEGRLCAAEGVRCVSLCVVARVGMPLACLRLCCFHPVHIVLHAQCMLTSSWR